MNLRKIRIALAIIGAVLSIALIGIKIHNEISPSRNTAIAAPAAPVPQKMTYTLTLSREVVSREEK